MMIDSVVWAQRINVTDTQTATSPQQMPRHYTASNGNPTCYVYHMVGLADLRRLIKLLAVELESKDC